MRELHVDASALSPGDGSQVRPFGTIGEAAFLAQPGDTITIHAGVYRETVVPPRGGLSHDERITYRAAAGERVVVTGSDVFTGWTRVDGDVWRLTIPNAYFGEFNPYAEVVAGDWFLGNDRSHRLGTVFVRGDGLPEAVDVPGVFSDPAPSWTATISERSTEIVARLPGADPNKGDVEVGIRRTVFTPSEPHIDYVTVRGLTLINAATNWAAPTSGQEGLITALWCKGWIIEDNEIAWSRCCGIALAKYGDEWDGLRGTTEGYYATIIDAREQANWNRETIGGHIVRNNVIRRCGQTGIVGSLGCAFSEISGNDVSECNTGGIWGGWEMAGVKLHGAIDTVIERNRIHHNGPWNGLWLDWMAQGTIVRDNLFHDNDGEDIFIEVSHGPVLVANNILLSQGSYRTASTGVVFAHNLIAGAIEVVHDDRRTPVLAPHDTDHAAYSDAPSGGTHWLNNVFVGEAPSLDAFASAGGTDFACRVEGNVWDAQAPVLAEVASAMQLRAPLPPCGSGRVPCVTVTTALLGRTPSTRQEFTEPDGSGIVLDADYFGRPRSASPAPGPIEEADGALIVWPRSAHR